MQNCPCCSGKAFQACCEPLLLGKQHARNPEQLMRSRYAAFVKRNVDYIFLTMIGPALASADREEIQNFVNHTRWTGLKLTYANAITPRENTGFVEFSAHFIEDGRPQVLSERSKFIKINSDNGEDFRWFYYGGEHKRLDFKEE